MLKPLLLFIAVLFHCNKSYADLVFDSGAGGASGIETGIGSDNAGGVQLADDFVLASSATITNVEWTGLYVTTPSASDNFTIRFYADSGNSPATSGPLASFNVGNLVSRTDSGSDIFGVLDIFNYSADVNFSAAGGTRYWLSIFNDTQSIAGDSFFWGADNGVPGSSDILSYGSNTNGTSWFSNTDGPLDFRLNATAVPEPTSVILLGAGFIAMAVSRRRRSRVK